jgi:polynucleotide 5'-kinase involved in rRNA processing
MSKILLPVLLFLSLSTQAESVLDTKDLIKQCVRIEQNLAKIIDYYLDDDDFYCADILREGLQPISTVHYLLGLESESRKYFTRLILRELDTSTQEIEFVYRSGCKKKGKLKQEKAAVLRLKYAFLER